VALQQALDAVAADASARVVVLAARVARASRDQYRPGPPGPAIPRCTGARAQAAMRSSARW
jgi:hypothetical protein